MDLRNLQVLDIKLTHSCNPRVLYEKVQDNERQSRQFRKDWVIAFEDASNKDVIGKLASMK